MNKQHHKPTIVVSDTDHARLSALATGALARFPDIAEELQSEMTRAEVVSALALPAHVVRMGSTVEFRSNGGQHRRVELVFPIDADPISRPGPRIVKAVEQIALILHPKD